MMGNKPVLIGKRKDFFEKVNNKIGTVRNENKILLMKGDIMRVQFNANFIKGINWVMEKLE